ncbi:MAG: hypothetical protein H7329_20910 [Opitutaceae bacterium]|nr:hypothetical protein [Cytophagales bacterium]
MIPKCEFLQCDQDAHNFGDKYYNWCTYHKDGGIFGSGESYEQYQIIEEDFVNFIKYVPLTQDHFKVYSPILRDIILRSCVQIEIFFKEWSKELCSQENPPEDLFNKYNKKYKEGEKKGELKGVSGWKMEDYFIFKDKLHKDDRPVILVLPLNEKIYPFKDWTNEKSPIWWNSYNEIKHDGHVTKKNANLEVALYALAGLFHLHVTHSDSKRYLLNYSQIKIDRKWSNLIISRAEITTPIDSKKFLFKAISTGSVIKDFEREEKLNSRYNTL